MRPPIFLLIFFPLSYSYKILVYNPKFGHSMSNFMGSIADTLVDAGHDVIASSIIDPPDAHPSTQTSLISIIDPELSDGTVKSKRIYVKQSEATKNLYDDFTKAKTDFFAASNYNLIGAYFVGKFFGLLFKTQCEAILNSPDVIEKLKAQNFDVMIVENFEMCGVALTHVIKPKTFIGASSTFAYGPQLEEFGIPAFPSFDLSQYTSSLDVHSIWDRVWNLYADLLVRWSYYYMRTDIDELFQEKYGAAFTSVKSIATYSAYNFVNSEPLIDFATPTLAKIIYIGGIGMREPKQLAEDWERIFALRKKTILLSFGSFVQSVYLSVEIKRAILETIRSLPGITFIWKYEADDDFTQNEVSNVVLTKWMPQTDILNHPNLTAFITHGGMGSTLEMARAGVPGIIVPLFADQPRNAAMMECNGLGKIFDKFDILNSTKFAETIKDVVEDSRYRQRANHVSSMLKNKPHTAHKLVVKYVEFAAEFGAATALRPLSHEMSWIEYRNADIIYAGLLLCVIIIYICLKLAMKLLHKIGNTKKKAILYPSAVISLLGNGLLIAVVLHKECRLIGTYRALLISFACMDMSVSIVHSYTLPVCVTTDYGILYLFMDTLSLGPSSIGAVLNTTALCLFFEAYPLLACHFIYRYLAISKPEFINRHLPQSILAAILINLGFVGLIAYSLWILGENADDHFFDEALIREYNIDTSSPVVRNMFHINYKHSIDGGWNFTSLNAAVTNATALISTLVVIAICIKRTIHELKVNLIVSDKSRQLQVQLFRSLIVQFSVPFAFVVIPFSFLFIAPFAGSTFSQFPNVAGMIVSTFPSVDPFLVLLSMPRAARDIVPKKQSSVVQFSESH